VPIIRGTNFFGSGDEGPNSFRGVVYFIPPGTPRIPNLDEFEPVAVLYTRALDISPREFNSGFPGVHDRFEWFAVRYDGTFIPPAEGDYGFRLVSDDGSKLYVDDTVVVDNDGGHAPRSVGGHAYLTAEPHRVRVDYFQGPRFGIALQLFVTPPGGAERIYDAGAMLDGL
jgi:hypothetical protein